MPSRNKMAATTYTDKKPEQPILLRILADTIIDGRDVRCNRAIKIDPGRAQDLIDSGEADSVKEAVDYALSLNPDIIDFTGLAAEPGAEAS